MITVLQRQHVSRREASPVHLRARSVGVRWKNWEKPSPTQALTGRHAPARPPVKGQDRFLERIAQDRRADRRGGQDRHGGQDRSAPRHSFLQGQLINRKRRRAVREIQQGIQRIAARQSARPAPAPGAAAREGGRGSALARALRSPWLVLGLVLAVAGALFAPSAARVGLALAPAHPALPPVEDTDQALYALLVPETAAPPDGVVSPVLMQSLKVSQYRAQKGDSVSKIAARFKLNVDTLVSWNEIANARSISAGTQLEIPNRDGLKYRVHRGDTLQGIANSFAVDFNSLLDANMLASSRISVGQELFVPGARMSSTELGRVLGNLFIFPVLGPISSHFGGRPDPFTGASEYHNGIDIVNKPGTTIAAAMAGTIAQVGWNYSYGYYVIIKHAGNYQTLYGHLTRYVVAGGQKVQQGQKIGELGTTGYSTGPHLHFSVFKNGQPVDPLRFLK